MSDTILESLLIAVMFGSGFLLSRIFIKCGIAESLVFAFMRRSKGHIGRIIIYIVFLSSFISMLIPNIIAILTILPILEILKKDLDSIDNEDRSLTTALAMANLYGSNIGGVGFIIGSATNIILITYVFINKIEGAGRLNFISWMGWGVPFVLISSAIACLVIIYLLVPKKLRQIKLNFTAIHAHKSRHPHQKVGIILSIAFFVFWIVLSIIHFVYKQKDLPYILITAALYFIAFNIFLFFVDFHDKKLKMKSRLLYAPDIISNFPRKGFILTVAAFAFAALLLLFKVDDKLYELLGVSSFPMMFAIPNRAVLLISLVLTTLTIFVSEFLSNTATMVASFTAAVALCTTLNIPVLPVLIGISIIATVPAMSPIASPVNAMAFGGLKGVSLKRMMAVGFIMDVIAIALVNIWVVFYLPWYYNIRL